MKNSALDELTRLQEWYVAQCNGDWEHQYGVRIGNIDNPGWSLDIDLWDTPLAEKAFIATAIERSDSDWVHCKVEEAVFKGRGGALNLRELLQIFLAWTREE